MAKGWNTYSMGMIEHTWLQRHSREWKSIYSRDRSGVPVPALLHFVIYEVRIIIAEMKFS